MFGSWDDIYAETHEILGFKDRSYEDYIRNAKDESKADSSRSEMCAVKILSMLNNKSSQHKLKFIKQTGEHHPDIRLKYKGVLTNIEVTKVTHADNRFEGGVLKEGRFNLKLPDDIIEHDKTKLMLTSKIVEKAEQYKKWIKKGIVGNSDMNIIAIDCGDLFPATQVGPILFSAYNFLKDIKEFQLNHNKELINVPLVSPREIMHKEKICDSGERELIPIYQYEILDAIKNAKIDGVFAFFHAINRVDLQIISINNNPLMDDLYRFLISSGRNMKVDINRQCFLY